MLGGEFLLAPALAATLAASPEKCPIMPFPTVYVDAEITRGAASKKLTAEDLAEKAGKKGVRGLHGGKTGAETKLEYTVKSVRGGITCVGVRRVNIKLYIESKIYVAKELKYGTCMYNMVSEHEREHAKNARVTATHYKSIFNKNIREALDKAGRGNPVDNAAAQGEANRLAGIVNGVVQKTFSQMNAEIKALQSKMDTPEAYAADQAQCLGKK